MSDKKWSWGAERWRSCWWALVGIGAGLTITPAAGRRWPAARASTPPTSRQTLATRVAAYRAELTRAAREGGLDSGASRGAGQPRRRAHVRRSVPDRGVVGGLPQSRRRGRARRQVVVARGIEPGVARKATARVPSAQAVDSAGPAAGRRGRHATGCASRATTSRWCWAGASTTRCWRQLRGAEQPSRSRSRTAGASARRRVTRLGPPRPRSFVGSEAAGTFVDPARRLGGRGGRVRRRHLAARDRRSRGRVPCPSRGLGRRRPGRAAVHRRASSRSPAAAARRATVPACRSRRGGGVSAPHAGVPRTRVARRAAERRRRGAGTRERRRRSGRPRGPTAATALAAESAQQFGRYTAARAHRRRRDGGGVHRHPERRRRVRAAGGHQAAASRTWRSTPRRWPSSSTRPSWARC